MRSRLLPFTFGALLTGLVSLPAPAQIQLDVSPEFVSKGIATFGSNEGQFMAFINALADSSLRTEVAPVLPYSFTLTNNARLPIAVVVVRFPRHDAAGRMIDGSQEYVLVNSGASQAPGTTLMFTPSAWLTQELNAGGVGRQVGPSASVLRAKALAAVHRLFDPVRFPQTTISLDSVVLSDGTLIGPDRLGLLQLEARRASALAGVQAELDDPFSSDAALINWLKAAIQEPQTAPVIDPATGAQDRVQLERSAMARSLLGIVEQYGRSSASKWLAEIESSPTTSPMRTIHRENIQAQ